MVGKGEERDIKRSVVSRKGRERFHRIILGIDDFSPSQKQRTKRDREKTLIFGNSRNEGSW